MSELHVSPTLSLPRQFVTHRNALLGMSGSGKSNASVVIAEEMFRAALPWIAIDPKGDWFGIRSSRDGKHPGLDVPIIGGEHGDLPLAPAQGKRLGELVAQGKLTGIFDLSGFDTDAERARFMADFGRALFRGRTTPIHIFCDECHEYMPQPGAGGKLEGPAADCVGVWKRILTQGRQKGLGVTLASQRTASVNKTCLYQCDTLLAFRTMGKLDRKAIEQWVDQVGDARALLEALPRLADGEAFVWSPMRLKIEKRVLFRRRETFDSGRTPEVGEAVVAPKLADLDIDALRAEFLEHELAEIDGESGPAPDEYRRNLERLGREKDDALNEVARLREVLRSVWRTADQGFAEAPSAIGACDDERDQAVESPAPVIRHDAKPRKPGSPEANGLGKCDLALLTAIYQHGHLKLSQAAIIAGYSPAASTCSVAMAKLKRLGFVTTSPADPGKLDLTDKGVEASKGLPKLPKGRALAEHWYGQLGRCERELLQRIVRAYPKRVALATIAKDAGYSMEASTVSVATAKLRRLELVSGKNDGLLANEKLS